MDPSHQFGTVKGYHEQTKHHPHRYARSLGFLDWNNQPTPFRIYEGSPQWPLPLSEQPRDLSYAALYACRKGAPDPLSIENVSVVLELSLGLSAWKKDGGSEWALRINPSSGNLHPTEATLILPDLSGRQACVAHYHPYQHALEVRTTLDREQAAFLDSSGGFGVVLTSIPWREAWKYGERAYRYCQHDLGHALGALRFAANLNGWTMKLIPQVNGTVLDALLGFDQVQTPEGEPEWSGCLCWISPKPIDDALIADGVSCLKNLTYDHVPNQLSREHVAWELIDRVHAAVREGEGSNRVPWVIPRSRPIAVPAPLLSAEKVIRQRRSAQRFDRGASTTERSSLIQTLLRGLPTALSPFDAFPYEPQVHLVIFVHAVEGLEQGLYLWVRNDRHVHSLREQMRHDFDWHQVEDGLPFYRLQRGDFRQEAQAISCGQAIAGDSAYSLGMLAWFDPVLMKDPSLYPRLFWETGLVGQVLYLEAEARGLRATGIGCFFDDQMHALLGLRDGQWQSLYHFTVGAPLEDTRLETKPPYSHLDRS